MDVAADHGVPVVVAAGLYALSEPLQMMELALAYPTVPIVMTSGGQINISGLGMLDAWLALQRAPNLHVTTNGEYRQDFIERLARDLDPARVAVLLLQPLLRSSLRAPPRRQRSHRRRRARARRGRQRLSHVPSTTCHRSMMHRHA